MVSFFEVPEPIDSAKAIEYWKYGYYDSIPKVTSVSRDTLQSFSEMVVRYQNKDFEYVESISNKLNFLDKLLYNISSFLEDLFPAPQGDFNEGIFNFLAVLGGLIIIFLLYKFFISRKQIYIKHEAEDADVEEQVDFVERNLMEVDVKTYLEDALGQKNYALAIRYLQLMNIQVLGRKGIVHWNQSRTNIELMEGVENEALREDFLACASLFDYVWFGSFVVTAESYAKYADQFLQFQRRWS